MLMTITIFLYVIFTTLISIFCAGFLHEAGHYIAARYYHKTITFEFSFGYLFNRLPIPRFIWYMPDGLTTDQETIICLAGFGLEFLMMIPMYFIMPMYCIVAALHFIFYRFYSGEHNDFKNIF